MPSHSQVLKYLNLLASQCPKEKEALRDVARLLSWQRRTIDSLEAEQNEVADLLLLGMKLGQDPDTSISELVTEALVQACAIKDETKDLYYIIDLLTAKNLEVVIGKVTEGSTEVTIELLDELGTFDVATSIPEHACNVVSLTKALCELDEEYELMTAGITPLEILDDDEEDEEDDGAKYWKR